MQTLYGDIHGIPDTPKNKAFFKPPKTAFDRVQQELYFFRVAGLKDGYEGPGRYAHCRILCDTLWRSIPGEEVFRWHPWLEDQLEEYCRSDFVTITGPGSGGKTTGMGMVFILQWLASPTDTGALVCAPTRDGLKKKLWGDIRKFYVGACRIIGKQGHLIDSDLCIQSKKGDTKHGIFGITVAQGEEGKALGRIIGFHPRRIFVGVDELTDVSWAIIEALNNLFTGKQKASFISAANASSIFDSHGKMCEPKEGWGSVTVNSNRWETKRGGANGGVCLHLDGFKCENIVQKKVVYDFLLTQQDIDITARDYGMDSPQMWRMRRGFWCPEGVVKSVLTESLIQRFRCMEKATWRGGWTDGASLDPAFEGGDRCVLRHVRWGKAEQDIDTLWLDAPEVVKIDAQSKEPIHYQIARQVKERCRDWGVEVQNFAMDSTGEGGGLASIIATEWAPGFLQVEFGGKASDLPVSKVNRKTCSDEYYNRVTELWYFIRTIVQAGQLRGLDAETAIELSTRIYTVETKIRLESKADMKKRLGGRSPDLGDNAAIAVELARVRGGLGAMETSVDRTLEREWSKLVEEFAIPEDDAFMFDSISNI